MHLLNQKAILALFFALAPICLGENDGIILLTNMTNGLHQIQLGHQNYECAANGKEAGRGTDYGLLFKMLEGECPGLLICYPSQQDAEGNGQRAFKLGRKFAMNNRRENEAAKRCRKKWEEEGKEDWPGGWHGILVQKDSIIGSNITLELSFADMKYKFIDCTEFAIQFDNGKTPSLLIGGDVHVNAAEKHRRTEFVEQMNSGAILDDFTGLWALSMDLFPMGHNAIISLYVYRPCDCSMKSWFQNGSQEEMPEWGEIDFGSNKCPHKEDRVEESELKQVPLDVGQTLNISARLENNTDGVEIQLAHQWTRETWERYVGAIIDEELMNVDDGRSGHLIENWRNYNYGDLVNITIKTHKIHLKSINRFEMVHYNGTFSINRREQQQRFTLQIHQHRYHLAIGLNGQIVVKEYWLYNWWDQLRMNILRAKGMQILYIHPLYPHSNIAPSYKMPFAHKLTEDIRGNQTIVIRAFLPQNATYFAVYLLYNTNQILPGKKISLGELIFSFSSFPGNASDLMINPNKYHKRPDVPSPFRRGQAFEIRIDVPPRVFGGDDEIYSISMNFNQHITQVQVDKNAFPLWKINTIRIEDAEVVKMPFILPLGDQKGLPKTDYSISIRHLNYLDLERKMGGLLHPHDKIVIKGMVPENSREFRIMFCYHQDNCVFDEDALAVSHHINKASKIGDIVLGIRFAFDNHDEKSLSKGVTKNIGPIEHGLPRGQPFQLQIVLMQDWSFSLIINQKQPIHMPLGEERPPSWSSEYIHIFGDVEILRENVHRESTKKDKLEMPFIMPIENGLEIGTTIRIKGNITTAEADPSNPERIFQVGIYHNGFGNFDEFRTTMLIGEALFQMDFKRDGMVKVFAFYKYNNNNELKEGGGDRIFHDVPMDGTIDLEIRVIWEPTHETMNNTIKEYVVKYEFRINNQIKKFLNHLPLWAADYLYIDGAFKLTEDVKIDWKK